MGDVIEVAGLIVNSFLAVWIVRTLQRNQNKRRFLKEHLIQEIKEIRSEYRRFLNDLSSAKVPPKHVISWFKLMNIKVQDAMNIIHNNYKIEKDYLNCYQIELREIVTEFPVFNQNFKDNKCFKLDEGSMKEILIFQQDYYSKFNSLIIKINDKN